jgi:DNA-binding CsgD family transcriptional regulator/Flp pilus assembly protein TadD
MHLTEADVRAGDLTAALDHAERACDLAMGDVGEQPWPRYLVGYCLAHLGRTAEARRELVAGVEISRQYGALVFLAQNLMALGFLEVSTGDYLAAATQHRELRGVLDRLGLHHPGVVRWQGDAMEAMVATGDLATADDVQAQLAQSAAALGLEGCQAIAVRGEGLLAAARGEIAHAVDAFTRATELHDRVEAPVDRARTNLLLGAAHRRLRHKAAARSALEDAANSFEAMGLVLWSARAREELARIGSRPAKPFGLSPTELQVARHAADGKTNREIAAELFISVKTVEADPSSIYRKLGLRSRTELARWVTDSSPPSPSLE